MEKSKSVEETTPVLKDPFKDRKVNSVPLPYIAHTSDNFIWPKGFSEAPDLVFIKDFLKRAGKLSKKQFLKLIADATQLLRDEPNVLRVKAPCIMIGDIHGQFWDFCKLIEGNLELYKDSTQSYLFLGDYVDRGIYSTEVLILLFSFKIANPKRVHILRGNHESRAMTAFFTFRRECLEKYDNDVYDRCMKAFDAMPLCCVVADDYLCVHAGFGPDFVDLK